MVTALRLGRKAACLRLFHIFEQVVLKKYKTKISRRGIEDNDPVKWTPEKLFLEKDTFNAPPSGISLGRCSHHSRDYNQDPARRICVMGDPA